MSVLLAEKYWTAEEFLLWESQQTAKYELIGNRVYAMTGVSPVHNEIAGNLIAQFKSAFRDKRCSVYFSDIRVQIDADQTYTYPDVVLACGTPEFAPNVIPAVLTNPTIIFEILPPHYRSDGSQLQVGSLPAIGVNAGLLSGIAR